MVDFCASHDGGELEVFVISKAPRRAAWLSTHVTHGALVGACGAPAIRDEAGSQDAIVVGRCAAREGGQLMSYSYGRSVHMRGILHYSTTSIVLGCCQPWHWLEAQQWHGWRVGLSLAAWLLAV